MLGFNRFRGISSHVLRNVRGDAYYSQVYRHGALGKEPDCCTGQAHSGERFLERGGDYVAGLRSNAVPCSKPYLDFARTGALVWDCMDECVVSYGSNIAGWYLHGRLGGGLGRGWVGDWSLCRCSAHSDLGHGLMFGANAVFFIFV